MLWPLIEVATREGSILDTTITVRATFERIIVLVDLTIS